MKISIINGPNLNLTGIREPEVYGNQSLEQYLQVLAGNYGEHSFQFFQSNIEGELVNAIQEHGFWADALLLNAGAYTHTSLAMADALRAVPCKHKVEIHLSNVFAREAYRRQSFIAEACTGSIGGFGLNSYELGVISALLA